MLFQLSQTEALHLALDVKSKKVSQQVNEPINPGACTIRKHYSIIKD
jgi:hypothetical protein